jgi:hypothetical protein
MKLTSLEEKKITTEAVLAALLFLGVLVGVVGGGRYLVGKKVAEQKTMVEGGQSLLEQNRKDAKEIKFLSENQTAIDTMWSTLKGWGSGLTQNQVLPLTQSGLGDLAQIPASKVPGNPTEYSGLRLSGDKTEYQRFLDALAGIESQEGLMQVRSCILELPSLVLPNSTKPTYLRIQVELVAPVAK